MILQPASEADYESIVALANLAYRGSGASASWNVEVGIIEGQRLSESLLRQDLAAKPDAHLLAYREDETLLGCVWLEPSQLEPSQDDVWYLGLLAVRPDRQNRQLGRTLLASAEDFARERGARRIRMTVVNVRDTLIAWYERRGYALTGETQPFPYGDERFGRPLREDLFFVVLEKDI
jgi:predicted N-acetyltransferase YhbS